MKRNLFALSLLVLLVATAACTTVTAPGTAGVVTAVGDNTVTISGPNGQATTYTLTSSTYVYNANGSRANQRFLSNGQRVMVWSKGDNTAVRINVES